MSNLPTGTVTFLFTDIEGSTERWERDRAAMQAALDRHNAILSGAIEAHGGAVFKTVGDAYCAVFANARDALEAAVDAQRLLHGERFQLGGDFEPLRVRMGIHTGLVELKDGDYFGRPVNRIARLMSAGHGGQILLSLATQQLVRDSLVPGRELKDLGVHRLKDLEHTEHLFRLRADGWLDNDTPPDTAERIGTAERIVPENLLADATCPYRGLHAFREEDARFFFGREAFTELLVDAVSAEPMLGVIGPSGSGKSSVVHAGLLPRLRADASGPAWTIAGLRPGGKPFQALAGALVPLLEPEMSRTDRLVETGKMAEALASGHADLHGVVDMIREAQPGLGRLFLVADQFEELYTLCDEEAVQRGFQDLLFEGAFGGNGSGPALWLALTLRADFMGHALAYRPFADAMQKHDVKLGPMNRRELTDVIARPAELQGRAFEAGLVERIIDDVGEKAGRLPLLEFALTKLWDKQEAGWLTHEVYESIGRVDGAVARHADTVFGELTEGERERARRVFVQMVQPGEGTEDTRRLATRAEIGEDWPLVRRLADARLVTTSRDADGSETVEVVHEALVRSWQRLREWMNSDRRFRVWQERLRLALRQWEETGCDEGALLRGVPLAEAEQWMEERSAELSEAEQGYVEAGAAAREHRETEREVQRQREVDQAHQLAKQAEALAAEQGKRAEEQERSAIALRKRAVWLLGALGVAAVLALAAVTSGWMASRNAERAERSARESGALALAANARRLLSEQQIEPALAVALEALAETEGEVPPEIELPLSEAAYAPGSRMVIQASDVGIDAFALAPDGRHALTGDRAGQIIYWDLDAHNPLWDVQVNGAVYAVAISPDGQEALGAGAHDGYAILRWDASTGEARGRIEGHKQIVRDIRFDAAGSRLASVSSDATMRVWSASDYSELFAIDGHGDDVSRVMFSPDGRAVASTSRDEQLSLWNTDSGDVIQVITTSHGLGSVAFDPRSRRVAGGLYGTTSEAFVWDADTGELQATLRGHINPILSMAFTAGGRSLVTASYDGTIRRWDSQTGVEQARYLGHASGVTRVAVDAQRERLFSVGEDGTLRMWDLVSPAQALLIEAHDGGVEGVAVSPDGRHLLTGGRDALARLWDLATGRKVLVLEGHGPGRTGGGIFDVALSPSGRDALTAGDDATLRSWDLSSGEQRWVGEHGATVRSPAYSPDGRVIVSGGYTDTTARLWEAATGRELGQLGLGMMVFETGFMPDGRVLVGLGSGSYDTLIWDVVEDRISGRLSGHNSMIQGVGVLPDGRTALSVSSDHSLRLWDLSGLDPNRALHAFHLASFDTEIRDFDLSPDGRHVLLGLASGDVLLWEIERRAVVRRYAGHGTAVRAVAFTPDGRQAVSGSFDGTVRVWRVHDSAEGLATWALANRFVRELSCSERVTYRTRLQCEDAGADEEEEPARGTDDGPHADADAANRDGGKSAGADDGGASTVAAGPKGDEPLDSGDERAQDAGRPLPIAQRLGIKPEAIEAAVESADQPDQGDKISGPLFPPLVEPASTAEPRPAGAASLGSNGGMIESGRGQAWSLEAEAGQVLHIRARADTPADGVFDPAEQTAQGLLDTVLVVRDPDGRLLAHNESIYAGFVTDAESRNLKMVDGGAYTIEVHSNEGRTSGSYTLEIESVALAEPLGDALTAGANVEDLAWLNGGRHVIGALADGSLRVWDMSARRELRRLIGHSSAVLSVVMLDAGETALSSGADKRLIWWDLTTGTAIHRLDLDSPARRLRLGLGGATVVSGHWDGSVRMLDAHTGVEQRRFEGHTGARHVWGLAISPDGRHVLSGSADAVDGSFETAMLMWDVETGELLRSFEGHWLRVYDVAFSPNGERIVSGGEDGHVILWDAETGAEIRRLGRPSGPVRSVGFVDDGRQVLAFGNADATIRLLDTESGEEVLRFMGHESSASSARGLSIAPDGRRFISGSSDWHIQLWAVPGDVAGTEILDQDHTSRFATVSEVRPAAVEPDDADVGTTVGLLDADSDLRWTFTPDEGDICDLLVEVSAIEPSGDRDSYEGNSMVSQGFATLQVIDAESGAIRVVAILDPEQPRRLDAVAQGRSSPFEIKLQADRPNVRGNYTLTLRTSRAIRNSAILETPERVAPVRGMALSPDGSTIASGDQNGHITLWDARSGEKFRQMGEAGDGETSHVRALAFSPDGQRLLSASTGQIILWDVGRGEPIRQLEGHAVSEDISGLAFHPDGRRALSGSFDDTAIIWDVETGQILDQLKGHSQDVHSVAFSPDGSRAYTSSRDRSIRVWDTETGEEAQRLVGHTSLVTRMAFTADGRRLLSASSDKNLVLWEVSSGSPIRQLEGHTDQVVGVAISPDGHWGLSGSYDGSARLWDLSTGEEIARLLGHKNAVREVAFTPDGQRAITNSLDGTVRIWDLSEVFDTVVGQ